MSTRGLVARIAAVALLSGAAAAGGLPWAGETPWAAGPVELAAAAGVGGASWTPSRSTTLLTVSEHLVPGDGFLVRTTAEWSRAQRRGLARYVDAGLRYTYEVNDRSGRLSATGYWATNHPDPAFDRDDDDGDARWEEAEVTVGAQLPAADRAHVSIVQFSRWHGKPRAKRCAIAWDRRTGSMEVLSQLSRQLLGEWQAERYTHTYDRLAYPRVGGRPPVPTDAVRPTCGERPPRQPSHEGVVVTFAAPLAWDELVGLAGQGLWLAFEATGTSTDDARWTCGGPVEARPGPAVCEQLGVSVEGLTAVSGYVDGAAGAALRADPRVARVEGLRDPVVSLIGDLGAADVEPPDLTIDDAWWELTQAA